MNSDGIATALDWALKRIENRPKGDNMNPFRTYFRMDRVRAAQWFPPGNPKHCQIDCVVPTGINEWMIYDCSKPVCQIRLGEWIVVDSDGHYMAMTDAEFGANYELDGDGNT